MNDKSKAQILNDTVETLSRKESLREIFHQHIDGMPIPSGKSLQEVIDIARSILFPGYYGKSTIKQQTIQYHIGVGIERLNKLLSHEILAGLCFASCDDNVKDCDDIRQKADLLSTQLIARLPEIRRILTTDVKAAYNGDPAATSYEEIICCYPAIKALTCYRIAHELYILQVPLIPRMITELAHNETGIDIHPAATIGEYFTIDHGTGVVIGATCIIGNNVKLYQGVTLGAKSFPLDDKGNPIKGIPRHPILEDNVIVYSNATVLGRVTIGKGTVIGANQWITHDTKPEEKII